MWDEQMIESTRAEPPRWKIQSRPGPGGRKLDYIAASVIIETANRIFGPNGWGVRYKNPPQWSDRANAYVSTATVWVTGAGEREGTGVGVLTQFSPDGHEQAIKTAESDALKRAMRHFGAAFGNSLYYETPANSKIARKLPQNTPQRG